MFKNTAEFFEEVVKDQVTNIDITNYIELITQNKVKRLKVLLRDLDEFIDHYKNDVLLYHTLEDLGEYFNSINAYTFSKSDFEKIERIRENITKLLNTLKNKKFNFTRKYLLPAYEFIHPKLRLKPKDFKIRIFSMDALWEKENNTNRVYGDNALGEIQDFYVYLNTLAIEECRKYIIELIDKLAKPKNTPKHEHIFANDGFVLFEHILERYVPFERGWRENLSYYYRKMFQDKYIHKTPFPFIDWFSEKYEQEIGKLKTIDMVKSSIRYTNYINAKKWLREQINS